MWSKSGNRVVVDGGICENLPIEPLKKEEKKFGDVIAVTFEPTPTSIPTGLIAFALSLLDAAMSNSVDRARALLPKSSCFPIGMDLGLSTFDF